MSQHYLIDLFGNPVSTARIIDVRDPTNLQTMMNGSFIIRVPSGVQVVNPVNVTDLLTQKYQGLLAENAGMTRVTFDDLLDGSHLDPTASQLGFFGQRGTISLSAGGLLQSVSTPLTGSAPTQALVTWEVFSVSDSDPSTDRLQRTYTELASTPSQLTCSVSFDGGVTFNTTTDSTILNIPLTSQGTSFIIRLTNVTSGRLYIGSWAIVY